MPAEAQNTKQGKIKIKRLVEMKKGFYTTLMASAMALMNGYSGVALAQAQQNPLDQFRSNMATQDAPAQNQRLPDDVLPSPTIGGAQQQGLTQDQIDAALQNYNLGDSLSLEERRAEAEARAREAAFEAMMNGTFPLTPEEIRQLLDRYRDVREATEERIGGPAEPEIKMATVSLDPGSVPPIIQLSPGYVTTLNILDASGQPWPIQDISWGGNFEIIQPSEGENIVRISPMKAHEVGNISMRLLDLNTPVIFTLKTGLDRVQVRFDAQIPEYGPNAQMPLIDTGGVSAQAGGEDIVFILDGTPPAGSEKLEVTGTDGRTTAFNVNGQVYVRTPLTLLSPGWRNSVSSADGTTVYAIGQSPVLLLSDNGKMVRAMIDYN